MQSDEIILGIDLGTTYSAAAYVDEHGRPTVIPNVEGEKTTPSVVMIENGQIVVGKFAANQAIAKHDSVLQWIKRSMGDLDYQFEGLGPIEISAEILKKIKTDCEHYFADRQKDVQLKKAVITCPAYFSAYEVENTRKAGELAGFEVQEIIREPTAAAVYYGVEHMQDGNKLLVCDLGGGTFDASILALEVGVFRPLATAGSRQLGGHDWTSDLMKHVSDQLMEIFGEDPRSDPITEQYLYDSCERLKRDFAHTDRGIITCNFKDRITQVSVTRDEFEQLTEWRIKQVQYWAEQSLTKTHPPLSWQDIDNILLVGGSTRLRRLAEALKEVSGKQPIQTAEADTMVAIGAAILAKGAYKPRRSVTSSGIKKNVVSGLTIINFMRTAVRNFGTRVLVRAGKSYEVQNSAIIPYGTELPTEQVRTDYRIANSNQASFDIPIVEYDDIGPDVIQDTYRFHCSPALARGTVVHIKFEYDKNGQIDVEAIEQNTNQSLPKERIRYEEPEIKLVLSPRRVVFALDVSGSMSEYHKLDRAKQALLDNARLLLDLGGDVQLGVVAFGSQANVVCPLTADFNLVQRTVEALSVTGMTSMHAGLTLALNMLAEVQPDFIREVILISDGMPDNPSETLAVGKQVLGQNIKLWLIGLGHEGVDEVFLKNLSPDYFVVQDANDLGTKISSLLMLDSPQPSTQSGITWL